MARGQPFDGDIDREIESWRSDERGRMRRGVSIASMLLAMACLVGARFEWIDAWYRGEIDLRGRPRFEPWFPIDRDALARVDLERVHAIAIPEWIERTSEARTRDDRRRAELAWLELRDAVAPDRNLARIWGELHERMTLSPIASARRIDWLLWAHDRYVDRIGAPYRIEASMHVRGRRAHVVALGYRVLAETRSAEGARVRVMRRIDRSRVVEGWLGHTPREDDGALVVADRVLHFAVRHVWPALNPALDGRRPAAERGLLPWVREEAEDAIPSEHLALLRETAEDEQVLIEVAHAIRSRHACGSRFQVFDLPYKGLSISSHQALRRALFASRFSRCPDITVSEAALLVGASERLRSTEGLDPALESMLGWVARSVAVHEARHVLDGPSDDVACAACDPLATRTVRAELSAYLTAMATPGVGYLATLHACATPEHTRGDHARAIDLAVHAAAPGGCGEDPGLGLYARAHAAEERLFGERAPITLPEGFPGALAFFPRSRAAVAEQ
ncbi:Hypothetical protein I5071_14660 [Sandaracinus amylolyticus]|nr:Hypothetical protein I5071_14660 [Sandaracinus amylolyticus]